MSPHVKVSVSLVALVAVLLTISSAVAAPPPGKGKPPGTGAGCKPKVAVILKGTLAATPGMSATSLSVMVKSSNWHGRAYVAAAQPTSILVNTQTKVQRKGKKTLAALLAQDRVHVQARVCKAELANRATPALTAARVVAHPAS
jgi:hypothetical protein